MGIRKSYTIKPNGSLNYLKAFSEFTLGDLSYSVNTRVNNAGKNSLVIREIIKGTRGTYDFSPAPLFPQRGRFRINFKESALGDPSYTVFVYTPNNTFIFTDNFGNTAGLSITNILLNFTTDFVSEMNGIGQTVNIIESMTDTATTGHVIFEITTVPYWNYRLVVTSTGYSDGLAYTPGYQTIDPSQAGDWIPVASTDLHGDLFSLWTTKKEIPYTIDIVSGTNDGAGGYLLTFATSHNYINSGLVILKGTPIDGQYIVQVISPTTLRVLGTTFTANFSLGNANFYPTCFSEFGVAKKDKQTGVWDYIRLVRTDQWNIRALKQPEIGGAEDNIFRKSFYWCDHYNPDRVFYYKGPYVQDGAIKSNNAQGEYDYTTIGQETKLIQNNQDASIRFLSQSSSGGNLLSGTNRYSGRFLSDDKTPTGNYLEPTGQINVYSAAGTPNTIGGDEGGAVTGKVNTLLVAFKPNLFRYFELISVYYTGGSQTAVLVKRVEISPGQSMLTVSHTGSEPASEDFDIGQLLTLNTIYDISKTLTLVDNFMVRSNMKTSSKQYDLSGFFKTFKHIIERKEIDSIGGTHPSSPFSPLAIGEYQVPLNMESLGGFMFFETYRILAKVRYKDGSISQLFWVDDIKIDFNTFNITATPTSPNFTNRRGANIWTANGYKIRVGRSTFVPYIDFYGYDLNYIIDGQPIQELIDEIIIERADVIREVLSSGVTVMGVGNFALPTPPAAQIPYNISFYHSVNPEVFADVAPFPFVPGNHFLESNIGFYPPLTTNPLYPFFPAKRDWGFYYSADGIFNDYHSVLPNDQIISFGSALTTAQEQVLPTGSLSFDNVNFAEYREFLCDIPTSVPNTVIIDDGGFVIEKETFGGVKVVNSVFVEASSGQNYYINQPCLALHFTSNLNDTGLANDYGMYQSYYYRGISVYDNAYDPDTSKYGNRLQSKGVVICEKIDTSLYFGFINPGTTNGAFGQDVFTQATFMKLRSPLKDYSSDFQNVVDAPEHQGYGGGIMFYSQNIVNSQMVFKDTEEDYNTWSYPNVTLFDWMYWWKGFQDNVPYDQSYNYINKPSTDVMYDSDVIISQLPATYFYSARKPLNSFIDPYRQFFPLNFVDESLNNGELTSHVVFNNQIYGLQLRSFRRRFMNSNAVLRTTQGQEAIIGDGSVLARVSEEISNIGCENKFSVLIGRSRGGNDVLYWWNLEINSIVRYGLDGTNPISLVQALEPFVRENTKWLRGKDYPAGGEGICAVWNETHKEAIWTAKGYAALNDRGEYNADTQYFYLDKVVFGAFQYASLGMIQGESPDEGSQWVMIYDIQGNYTSDYLRFFVNIFTLVFSELQNGFINNDRSYHPNIYFQFEDTYLSSGKVFNFTGMFEHEVGLRGSFYGVQYDGYDQWVFSEPMNMAKNFGHIMVRSEVAPYRMDFETNILNAVTGEVKKTYMIASDFTFRDGYYVAPIHNDSSITIDNVSGSNTSFGLDNGKLNGDFIKVKLTYQKGIYQNLKEIVCNFTVTPKYNNQ